MARMKVSKEAKKAADTFIKRIKTGVIKPMPDPTRRKMHSKEQEKAIKLINWMRREMARQSRIQKGASYSINLYMHTPQREWDPRLSLTPEQVVEFKNSFKLSWEKASGAWLAYASCIERLKKEFDI